MAYEYFIAKRYLRSKKKNLFISLITMISIGGVILGVTALIVVLSVMSGFEQDLTEKILATNAHGTISKLEGDLGHYNQITDKITGEHQVISATPYIINEVMARSADNYSGILLKGIDVNTAGKVTQIANNLEKGDLTFIKSRPAFYSFLEKRVNKEGGVLGLTPYKRLPGIILGRELTRSLRLQIGDPLTITAPLGDIGPFGPLPKSRRFRVAGIFYSGMYEYDSRLAYIGLNEAQSFFSMGKKVSNIEFKVRDIYMVEKLIPRLLSYFKNHNLVIKGWMELNQNLLDALKLEKRVMFLILIFIVLVASFNIISTLTMTVMAKTREISILKSMGADDDGIMRLFMYKGLIIGVLGTIIGITLGLILCFIINKYGIKMDPEVYYINKLPVQINLGEVLLVSVFAIVISLLATLFPALRAARVNPVEGLRNE